MRPFFVACLIAACWLKAGAARAQKDSDAKPMTLEQMKAALLKNNPDLRLAEAKLRLAEAKFARTRDQLLSKLEIAYAEVEAARRAEDEARIRYLRAIELFNNKSMGAQEFGSNQLAYFTIRETARLAEARLQALVGPSILGSPPSKKKPDENK